MKNVTAILIEIALDQIALDSVDILEILIFPLSASLKLSREFLEEKENGYVPVLPRVQVYTWHKVSTFTVT